MLRSVLSAAIDRLFIIAVIVVLANLYFRLSCGVEPSFVDQFNRLSGFDQLYRALDHRN
jgi:hypothetical protein